MTPIDDLHNLTRLVKTASYLSPRQVVFRARRIARQKWYRVIKKKAPFPNNVHEAGWEPLWYGLTDIKESVDVDGTEDRVAKEAAAIRSSEFNFLNHTVRFRDEPHWHSRKLSHLWRYHLHYFDYCECLLIDFGCSGNADNYTAFKYLVRSWIRSNRHQYGDGWHPYTLSVRIVNWLHALAGFKNLLADDPDFKRSLISSLGGQLQVLAGDLEYDVRGNHLVKNIRALLVGSSALDTSHSQKWLATALKVLRDEVAEQILADGGHFERNPGYHLSVLKDLLECAVWIQRNRKERYAWLDIALRRMLDWLTIITPSGGQLPLLKDTTRDYRPILEDVLAAGALYFDTSAYKPTEQFGTYPCLLFGRRGKIRYDEWERAKFGIGSAALEISGYYVMRDDTGADSLVFDAGKVCPDYLPAHAHADMLSYELTCNGQPLVVDSGVYEYTAGRWRDYFRSTRAHNTVELNGCNQSDVWGSFRVADRAYPGKTTWHELPDYNLVQASHDGYLKMSTPARHHRTIVWQKERFWLVWDRINGVGEMSAASHIHFHPSIDIHQSDESVWELKTATGPLWMVAFGHSGHSVCSGQVEPRCQGWYSEVFGKMMPNTVVTLQDTFRAVTMFGYLISKDTPATVVHQSGSGSSVDLIISHAEEEFRYGFDYAIGS